MDDEKKSDLQAFHDLAQQNISKKEEKPERSQSMLEEFQKTIHAYIEWLRPLAELRDLL